MKYLLSTTILLSFILLGDHLNFVNNTAIPRISDSSITISISAVGDIMCHSPQYEYAKVSEDSFDFNPVFREINKYISESDFSFGNLETVFAGQNAKYSGYPRFNTPNQLADALKNAGFDLLTTANNHSLDRGEIGIRKTIAELNARGINYNGTYVDQRDRDSIRIYDIRGVLIAFLAYSYGTNGNPIPKNKNYLINLIDYDLIERDINAAKLLNPDLILVHYHFGEEYSREPSAFQEKVVEMTFSMGADIIIGGHPHVLQPIKFTNSSFSNLDTVFIAYSLGNFISNQRKRYTDTGGIFTLHITKNFHNKTVGISGLEFLPTWVFKGNTGNKNEYVILPSLRAVNDNSITYLTKGDINKLNESIFDSKQVLTRYSTDILFR